MHTHFKFPRPSNDPSAVCFVGYLPWSLLKSFRTFDKGSVDKPWLEQITRRRTKLVSRSNCFAANAAAAFAAGVAVDVSLTCPFFLSILYAEWAVRASFFSSFSPTCGAVEISGLGSLFCKI